MGGRGSGHVSREAKRTWGHGRKSSRERNGHGTKGTWIETGTRGIQVEAKAVKRTRSNMSTGEKGTQVECVRGMVSERDKAATGR